MMKIRPGSTATTTNHFRRLATMVTVAVLAACAPDSQVVRGAGDPPVHVTPAAQPAEAGDDSLTDAEIVRELVALSASETALGRLATSRGSDTAVRALARRMVAEQDTLSRGIRRVAATLPNADGRAPAGARAVDRRTNARLAGRTGVQFDLAYLDATVDAHETSLAFLLRAASSGRTPALDSVIVAVRRAELAHLDAAWTLRSALAP